MATNHTTRPRILVVGAGAVGTLLGGILSSAGADVTLLGRDRNAEDVIQEHGLVVETPRRTFSTHPAYITDVSQLPNRPDIVVLATRCYGVAKTLPTLRELINNDVTLLTIQNGLGTDELIQDEMSGINHVAASVTLSADVPDHGRIATSSRSGGIALAPVTRSPHLDQLTQLFRTSGTPLKRSSDYRSMKWSKLVLNMMANVTAAILDLRPGEIYRDTDLFRIEREMLREAFAVLEHEGSQVVPLPGFPVPMLKYVAQLPAAFGRRLLRKRVDGGRGAKMPSLWIDLEQGRERTEIAWMNGAVADIGQSIGIPTPVNHRLTGIMDAIVTNPNLRNAFRESPERLKRNIGLRLQAELR
jgi:2-dehydropantoate 2-reductase